MTDDSAMEEGRLEEIEARCKDGNPYPVDMQATRDRYRFPWTRKDDDDGAHITDADGIPVKYSWEERSRIVRNLFIPVWNAAGLGILDTDVPDLLAEVRRLRAENDALKQNHWISCEMKMPPEDTVVLIYNGYMDTAITYYQDGRFTDSEDGVLHPTHWMLLPNSPGENERLHQD